MGEKSERDQVVVVLKNVTLTGVETTTLDTWNTTRLNGGIRTQPAMVSLVRCASSEKAASVRLKLFNIMDR